MNSPISWIKAYVPDLECEDQEFMDAMTLSGSKVEEYQRLDADLDQIIVGQIEKIEKHPDADKLVVCQVAINENKDTIQIVTGAPNVKEGQKVPVVLDGGKVAGGHDGTRTPGGIKIKKGKLRGVESFGMMCSVEELGSSTDFYPDAAPDGIYILSDNENYKDAPVGSDAIELLGLRDTNFEYEITSNRVDCFSILGLAREAAATFRKKFEPPVVKETGNEEKASDYISVSIENPDLCKRYVARVVKDIHLAPSPEWMRRRLAACGIRPINNLVDITNYVMEEFGQPMHAYDLDLIAQNKIVVRNAKSGEKFQTLDGEERTMDESVLMICDGEKPVGIAGIMGGENSKITDNVQTLLFEAACFDGTNIRLSGKKLGMRTDAQAKFEKGLDPETTMLAMNRACQLIEELGAGTVVGGCVDEYPVQSKPRVVGYDPEKINALLGTEIPEEEMVKYFETIDLTVDTEKKEVIVPTWRQDLLCLADLAEEVARFYGYDKIPQTLPSGEGTIGTVTPQMVVETMLRHICEKAGFSESMTYSFDSPKVFDRLLLEEEDEARKAITIQNPLGEDYSIMRTLPLNGLLTSLSTNYNHRNKEVGLYEMANVYLAKELPLTEMPDERVKLAMGMYNKGDFFTMKGVVEEILFKLGIKEAEYTPACPRPYLHPGRKAEILVKGESIGYMGELHPEVAENYRLGTKTYLAVLDVPALVDLSDFDVKFKGIAKFPAVNRDLSLVMKKDILAGEVEKIIRKNAGSYLEKVTLFDVYEGDQVAGDEKSLAYSLVFRAQDKTLEEGDVTRAMDKILGKLSEAGVEIRK